MVKELLRISESEWEIMKILWSKSPVTANEIIEILGDNKEWAPNTVKTLVSRLVKKGALDFTQEGRIYHYYPLINEETCKKAESTSFLKRIYGGSLKPMLVHFLESEEISEEDIEELKKILDERKPEK